jgi:hypothetical protein
VTRQSASGHNWYQHRDGIINDRSIKIINVWHSITAGKSFCSRVIRSRDNYIMIKLNVVILNMYNICILSFLCESLVSAARRVLSFADREGLKI